MFKKYHYNRAAVGVLKYGKINRAEANILKGPVLKELKNPFNGRLFKYVSQF